MGRLDNYNVYLHTYTLRYKQTQEKKSTLRYASLRGVEFFPMGKEERGGAAQGGFVLLILFIRMRKHDLLFIKGSLYLTLGRNFTIEKCSGNSLH